MMTAFVVGAAYAALCTGLGYCLGFLRGGQRESERSLASLQAANREAREKLYGRLFR